jgi:5'-3' exonuclease
MKFSLESRWLAASASDDSEPDAVALWLARDARFCVQPCMYKRLHVVDGTFELYRAHFSHRPPAVDKEGRDVKASLGVVAAMRALLRDPSEAVTHVAIAFDNPIVSFRNELYAGYKSDAGVPPELRRQFDLVEEAVASLGITVWSMDHFEADDALATATRLYAADFEQIRVLSPDKDLGACLDGERVVQVDRIRKTEMLAADFVVARGIEPSQMADYLALIGDSADGIPGVPGIGEKTAAALLRRYPSLERIPDDVWDIPVRGKERHIATLRAARAEAMLWKQLASLRFDVPLQESAAELAAPNDCAFDDAKQRAVATKLGRTTL